MHIEETKLPGVILITPKLFKDNRGYFYESYEKNNYNKSGLPENFVQDNISVSHKNVLRGLHCQLEQPQGKLVQVLSGKIFDVAVDIRKESDYFGKWVGVELDSIAHQQLYIPPGFAHGFCVLSESAMIQYKCTDYYHPQSEMTLLWNDENINIHWPIENPILSPKDTQGTSLNQFTMEREIA